MLCRESISNHALNQFHQQVPIINRYVVAELLLGDPLAASLRKEMRRLFDGPKTPDEELCPLLSAEVIKRDIMHGDAAKAAKSVVKKASGSLARKAAKLATGAT